MRWLLLLVALSIAAQATIVGFQLKNIAAARNQGRVQTCIGISKLDNTLIKLIREGEQTLPSLQYYKTHPDDLVKALGQDERAITALTPPKYC